MAKVTRFAYNNLLFTAGALIVPSSENTSMPRGNLLKPGASVRLRFASGWTIVAGENDKIDFDRGGVKVATIAAGWYATAALLAVAIVAALEAADATPVWACAYSGTTFKFTISTSAHSFVLLFDTGANVDTKSVHLDIGFARADTASALTHTGGSAAYQSRHAIDVDLGSAQAATAFVVRGHNISPAGLVVSKGYATTPIAGGFGAAGDYEWTLLGTDPRVIFNNAQSKRYLRLLITDVQNSVAYTEIGVWFVGPYDQPTICQSIEFVERYEPLSEIRYADSGAHHQVLRGDRLVYSLMWREIEQANIDIFRALNLAMPMGTSFFLSLDAVDNPTTSTHYGFLRRGLEIQMVFGPYSNVPLEFAETLG